jgi:PAS domain S-box-containing protein
MPDDARTKEQLAAELAELRARCDQLEQDAARWREEEKRLRRSHELFYRAFRTAPDLVAISTASDGRCVDVNDALVKATGYRRDEIIGRSIMDLNIWTNPEDRDRFFKELTDKGTVRALEADFRDNTGEIGVVHWYAGLVTVDDVQYFLTVAHDITDQKRAEKALQESEERYRFLAENMADIVWTLDLNLRTTYVSPSIEKVLGFTPEQRKRQTLEEMLTPESRQRTLEALSEELLHEDQGADPERPLIVEVEYYRRDGSTLWMENSLKALRNKDGVLIGMYGSSRDISVRKAAEEALRKSEASYRSLFENSPVSLWEVDFSGVKGYLTDLKDSGVTDFQAYFQDHPEAVTRCARLSKVIDVNQATLNMYGAETKEDLREPARMIYTPESWVAFVRTLIAGSQGEEGLEIATVTRTLAGERRDVILGCSALHEDEGLPERLLVSNTDITALRTAEEERERLINELQEALANIKTLRGLIPICSNCKKIRDDKGYWQQVEVYFKDRSEAEFTHGICPDCMKKLYPDVKQEDPE